MFGDDDYFYEVNNLHFIFLFCFGSNLGGLQTAQNKKKKK